MAFRTWNEIYENAYSYEAECANVGYKSRRVPPDDQCQWDDIVKDIINRIMLDCNVNEIQARIVTDFIDNAYDINDLVTFANTSRIFTDRLIKPLMQDNKQWGCTNVNME